MQPATQPSTGHSKTPAGNRRRGNRHRLKISASLTATGEKPIDIVVTELSVGGVGFQSKCKLELESTHQLTSFDTLIPPGMTVRIVSQRSSGNSIFDVGAKAV